MQLQKSSTAITKENYWTELAKINISASLSVFDAVNMGLPEISTLNRGAGSRENGLTFFKLIVLDILEFYGKEWPGSQIDSVADVLCTEYYYWSMAEAKHFAAKVKSGHYQDSIENISSNYIVKAALAYNSELLEARVMINDKRPQFQVEGPTVKSERISAFFNEFISTWESNIENERKARDEAYTAKQNGYQEKIREIFIEQLKDPSKLEDFRKHCQETGKSFNLIMEQLGL